MRSYHFGDRDSCFTTEFYHVRQSFVERCLLGAVIYARVVMLLFFIAKLLDGLEYLFVHALVILHQRAQLIIVVFDDHSLHCHGARHRRSLAHESGTGTQSEPGNIPQWGEDGGSDSVLANQFLEFGAVSLLLIPHVLYGRSNRRSACAFAENRQNPNLNLHLHRVFRQLYLAQPFARRIFCQPPIRQHGRLLLSSQVLFQTRS